MSRSVKRIYSGAGVWDNAGPLGPILFRTTSDGAAGATPSIVGQHDGSSGSVTVG